MPDEPNLSGNSFGGGSSSSGRRGGRRRGAMTGPIDDVAALNAELSRTQKLIAGIDRGMRSAGSSVKKYLGGIGVGGSNNPATANLGGGTNGHPTMNHNSPSSGGTGSGYMSNIIGGSGVNRLAAQTAFGRGDVGLMGAGQMAGAGAISTAVGAVFGAVGAATDARIQRGYAYSSSADKMSVMYQQITGMSNAQVRNVYRQPLTNYRLGEGGINTMLALQASTGISARGQAQSVEALRTLSGFSLGTGDIANMLGTMGTPQVANRMFMMTGMSLYKPGGGQRSGLDLIQNLARSSGLTGLKDPSSALQQGSNIRMRLADYGVDQATQDLVIQYAMANSKFRQKMPGGGMYDPGNKQHRVAAGIEDNFATQMEETIRTKMSREEDFYGRQTDNFAALEKRTQSLERTFGALEDKLSGIIGKDIQYSNERKVAGGIAKFAGPAMTALGMGLIAGGVSAPLGALLLGTGALTSAAGSAVAGDPVPSSPPKPAVDETMNQLNQKESFSKMSASMKDRVARMVAASGGRVGFGQGYRSPQAQEQMFRARYRKTNSATDANGKKNWFWEGSYWEHVSGPAAAPPGKSMHGIGLAADLTGDMNWIMQNASKFGLKHFGNSSTKEPWHVQPAEMPDNTTGSGMNGPSEGHSHGGYSGGRSSGALGGAMGSVSIAMLGKMSMAEAISSFMASNRSGATGGGGGGYSRPAYARTTGVTGGPGSTAPGVPSSFAHGGMARSGVDIARWSADFLNRVGAPVTLANLEAMSAWIAAEGTKAAFNPLAVVTDPQQAGVANLGAWTPFNTFGTNGKMHVWNFANYEQGLAANVYHMQNNGKRVINALKNNNNNPYEVIGAIEKMVSSWAPNYAARGVLESRHVPDPSKTGDPQTPTRSAMSSGNTTFTGGTTINISPTINVMSNGNASVDAQQIYREVMMLFEQTARLKMMRSA